jgi:hypothetical protein
MMTGCGRTLMLYWMHEYERRWKRAEKRLQQLQAKATYKPARTDVKRTPWVTFQRQIDPTIPGPDKCRPFWWGWGTLAFYEIGEDGKNVLGPDGRHYVKVWEQVIPESRWINDPSPKAGSGRLSCQVYWEAEYGWMLKLECSHDAARKFWEIIEKEAKPLCSQPKW